MRLAPEEAAILAGARGEAARDALAYQLKVGEFFGAERFVPITNVHMMGDIEVMGDGGLGWLRGECAKRARALRCPTTTNARCFDFEHAARLGQDPGEAAKERELIAASARNERRHHRHLHQLPDALPAAPRRARRLGRHRHRHLRQLGIRRAQSNFESGPAAIAAAMTGRTPEYGFHLDRHRKGTLVVRLETPLEDLADWGAVGKIVGEKHQNYYAVPVFTGAGRPPLADELKHLGAALASYGSMGMFHMVGVTPEAPTLAAALGGNLPVDEIVIDAAAIERVYAGYDLKDGSATLVVFSGPQLSLFELKSLAEALRRTQGARRHAGVRHHFERREERRARPRLRRRRSSRPA